VDRRIRWHYTTTILRLRIGARLTRYRNCRLNFTILLALSAGTAYRLVLAHLYPWTYRRVDAGPLHRPCSTYYASVVNKQVRSVNVRSFDFDFITPSPTVKPTELTYQYINHAAAQNTRQHDSLPRLLRRTRTELLNSRAKLSSHIHRPHSVRTERTLRAIRTQRF